MASSFRLFLLFWLITSFKLFASFKPFTSLVLFYVWVSSFETYLLNKSLSSAILNPLTEEDKFVYVSFLVELLLLE